MRLLLAAVAAFALHAADYDLLIRNARVVDGAGNPWFRADIAVRNGKIAGVGRFPDAAFSAYCLGAVAWAMFVNFRPGKRRWLSLLNLFGGLGYAALNLTYGFNPFLADGTPVDMAMWEDWLAATVACRADTHPR